MKKKRSIEFLAQSSLLKRKKRIQQVSITLSSEKEEGSREKMDENSTWIVSVLWFFLYWGKRNARKKEEELWVDRL